MKKISLKLPAAAVLTAVMVFVPVSAAAVPSEAAAGFTQEAGSVGRKSEVIYATLDAAGGVDGIYAVNHFEMDAPGVVTDHGAYSSVLNLTDTEPLRWNGDTVELLASGDNAFYQGNLSSTDLPWTFAVRYRLDGREISAADLSGKSGSLEIEIETAKNEAVDPVFYQNYMLQLSLTLDSDRCGRIEAPDAALASAGKDWLLTFTVLPETDADLVIRTTVNNFAMDGISVAALPFSMNVELPDTDGLTEQFQTLTDAVEALNGGAAELASGAAALRQGASGVKNGSSELGGALSALSRGSAQLTGGSVKIKNALSDIAGKLEQDDGMDPSQLSQLPAGLSAMADGLDGVSDGLGAMADGFATAYRALDLAIQKIPDATLDSAALQDLYAKTDPDAHGALDALVASYTAGQEVKATYAQAKAAFDAVSSTVERLTGSIGAIAGQLRSLSGVIGGALSGLDQLSELASGLRELADSYGAFHTGLVEYAGGVDRLAGGYAQVHNGIASLEGGASDLAGGAGSLHDGLDELNSAVSDLPETVQAEIDRLTGMFQTDFTPVSFLSDQNEQVALVQFVIQIGGVETPKDEADPDGGEEAPRTFWDRLVALFTGGA